MYIHNYIHICMLCMQAFEHARRSDMLACTHAFTCVRICVCVCVCVCVFIYVCVYIYIYMYMHVCMYYCVCVGVCWFCQRLYNVLTKAYIYIHIHTYHSAKSSRKNAPESAQKKRLSSASCLNRHSTGNLQWCNHYRH
jgi:hypothetical protein